MAVAASRRLAGWHYSKLLKIVIDMPPAEHDRELAFWGAATGQRQLTG
jgi:hypothetical protein